MSERAKSALTNWNRLWNGDPSVAEELLSKDFTCYFGADAQAEETDAIVGPEAFVGFVASFREARPGLTFTDAGHLYADDHAVSLWNAVAGESGPIGGVDVLQLDATGKVHRVYSVTGSRKLSTS
ncbi:nuclear transport factor 2 family protein [Luteipulveratus halotolerans]|nr:nuclear transport factor 2 family protein [Luteipulveratus halotolerans]